MSTAEPRRRFHRGRLLLAAGAVLALLLVGYLVAVLLLKSVLDPAGLADRLEPRISAVLNRPVSIEAARVHVFPRPAVRITGMRVENLGPFADVPLATVDEIRLDPRLLPLLRRRVEIDRVVVLGPRALLRVDAEGRNNFGDFVPEGEDRTETAATGMSLEVRRLEIRDGRLGYRDARTGRLAQLDGLGVVAAVARATDEGIRLDGAASVDSARFAWPPTISREVRGLPLELTAALRTGPRFGWAEIDSGTLDVRSIGLRIRGRVDSLRAAERTLDLDVSAQRLPLAELVASLPDSLRSRIAYRVEGEADVHVQISGPMGPGARPQVEGLVTVRGAAARDREGRAVLEDGAAEVVIRGARAEIERIEGRLFGGPLEARGSVGLDSTAAWELTVQMRPQLEAMTRALPPPADPPPGWKPISATGEAAVDAGVTGRLATPGATRATGSVVLREAEIAGGRLEVPVRIEDGRLELRGDRAVWRNLALRVGSDEIVTSGSLSDLFARSAPGRLPAVDADVRARRLDLDALRGARPDEIGYGRIAFAHLGGRSLDGRSAEEVARDRSLRRPDRLPLRGEVRLSADTVFSSPYRLTGVRGRALLSPDRVVVEDLAFAAYGGSGTGRLVTRLGAQESEPFLLDLDLRGVRAERFLAETTPLGGLVQGSLSLDLTLDGGLDRLLLPVRAVLQGGGALEIRDGRLGSGPVSAALASFLRIPGLDTLSFSRWTSPFEVRDGAVRLSEGRISAPDLALLLSGAVGFDGGLDLGLLLRPDETRARQIVASGGPASALLDGFLRTGAPLEIGILVGGTARDPRFELDPAALERAAQRAAEAAAEDAARRGRQELERQGQDLLRRLTGGRATDSAQQAEPPAGRMDTTAAPERSRPDTARRERGR